MARQICVPLFCLLLVAVDGVNGQVLRRRKGAPLASLAEPSLDLEAIVRAV